MDSFQLEKSFISILAFHYNCSFFFVNSTKEIIEFIHVKK